MGSDYIGMKMVLIIFKVLGLAPWNIVELSAPKNVSNNYVSRISRKPKLHCSKLDCVYPILFAVSVFSLWIMNFPPPNIIEGFNEAPVATIISAFYIVAGNVIAVVLRIILCVKQKTVVELFNRFVNIDDTIVSLANGRDRKSNRKFFVFLFAIDALVIVAIIVISNWSNSHILESLLQGILLDAIANWFIIQYVVMVRLVNRQFRSLNRALRASSSYSDEQSISSLTTSEISIELDRKPKILNFRRTHTELYELCRDVSELYSLPILFAIAHECYSLVYCAFYYVVPILIGKEFWWPFLTIHALLWIAVTMLPVFMLTTGVDETNYEIEKTAGIVHELLERNSISGKDKTELRQFSLELLHRKVEFTANGLFTLDSTLLHSIYSGVVKYLVIIAQFHFARNE